MRTNLMNIIDIILIKNNSKFIHFFFPTKNLWINFHPIMPLPNNPKKYFNWYFFIANEKNIELPMQPLIIIPSVFFKFNPNINFVQIVLVQTLKTPIEP